MAVAPRPPGYFPELVFNDPNTLQTDPNRHGGAPGTSPSQRQTIYDTRHDPRPRRPPHQQFIGHQSTMMGHHPGIRLQHPHPSVSATGQQPLAINQYSSGSLLLLEGDRNAAAAQILP